MSFSSKDRYNLNIDLRGAKNTVPALLVVGEREERFAAHRAFASRHMPHLEVVALDGGHAVNMDAAVGFNDALVSFIKRHTP